MTQNPFSLLDTHVKISECQADIWKAAKVFVVSLDQSRNILQHTKPQHSYISCSLPWSCSCLFYNTKKILPFLSIDVFPVLRFFSGQDWTIATRPSRSLPCMQFYDFFQQPKFLPHHLITAFVPTSFCSCLKIIKNTKACCQSQTISHLHLSNPLCTTFSSLRLNLPICLLINMLFSADITSTLYKRVLISQIKANFA